MATHKHHTHTMCIKFAKLTLENVEADGAGHAADIRMPNLRRELHFGRLKRIRVGNLDIQAEHASLVGRIRRAVDGAFQPREVVAVAGELEPDSGLCDLLRLDDLPELALDSLTRDVRHVRSLNDSAADKKYTCRSNAT